ncbi:hypothetical protein GCM10010389_49710 [Streptomyces echinoruber]|uniref:Uncharacterized protein n=1 Tax=Streptomyces echinoruber TaxID=68898 RepID=A0A918VKT4_9ACTN|nr:hypothetical protein GCM10010389_49710 [Streptomyces echinoruber]
MFEGDDVERGDGRVRGRGAGDQVAGGCQGHGGVTFRRRRAGRVGGGEAGRPWRRDPAAVGGGSAAQGMRDLRLGEGDPRFREGDPWFREGDPWLRR